MGQPVLLGVRIDVQDFTPPVAILHALPEFDGEEIAVNFMDHGTQRFREPKEAQTPRGKMSFLATENQGCAAISSS